ncbi:MAG: hypothetical protein LRZ88_04090, partial [Candidatus Cloacimonetes bacterium]|nr:hypothetical protein [Candidatus Cloacimonadota bacterium]
VRSAISPLKQWIKSRIAFLRAWHSRHGLEYEFYPSLQILSAISKTAINQEPKALSGLLIKAKDEFTTILDIWSVYI